MSQLTLRVRNLDQVASTNDEVKRALEAGEDEGLVVRARVQTGGYGRQGRAWVSPEGGLYCSWLLRPEVPVRTLPTLSLVVSMAVRRALVELSPAAAQVVAIKWPNDVVLTSVASRESSVPSAPPIAMDRSMFKKLCGISLEAHAGGVCVGTGVNVIPPVERAQVGGRNVPAYVADMVPALAHKDPARALDSVFDAIATEFSLLYQRWTRDGFEPLADEYNEHALLSGKQVRLVDRVGALIAEGAVARVDSFGRLVLCDDVGLETPVTSGEAHIA
ncbi:biotin--[acetyl-CoA-carboxylase] ligase [Paraeggerthella hongkongensis]|uniref:Biotin--[acetyl-CoA-carboxylase] ligase n=1 Tax=Paraeggerthella hongkongensis TaxID=230658 RepID=A0A3N0B2I6_9ACTN|nr:biotin--[acetyl-CoA-carboxylase] ligase [Paraeggerthella hongkongensis]RNL41312.1 biotin--[acetyl-CoA-carboxylase] ligase [Paraeggerthella hongkongensis]